MTLVGRWRQKQVYRSAVVPRKGQGGHLRDGRAWKDHRRVSPDPEQWRAGRASMKRGRTGPRFEVQASTVHSDIKVQCCCVGGEQEGAASCGR